MTVALVVDAEIADVLGRAVPTRFGTPQRNTKSRLDFGRLLKRAGLPTDFTFHNQRSTAASVAITDGVSLSEVSKMLGHKDSRTMANQHGHVFAETQREMAHRMARLILRGPSGVVNDGR